MDSNLRNLSYSQNRKSKLSVESLSPCEGFLVENPAFRIRARLTKRAELP